MKNNSQKGFVVPLVIAIVVILVLGGGYIYYKTQIKTPQTNNEASYSIDAIKTSINTATQAVPTQGDANKVAYLKIVDGTAYVLLAMDIDGWAGVSSAITKVHPVVEQTLLQFPQIKVVKFSPAPGDSFDSITKSYSDQLNNVTTEPIPVITSISLSSGPIGTVTELKGTNLTGFEGDLDAIIENSKGETAFLPGIGSVPRTDQTIRVKIDGQLCKSNNSYSGLPCTSYLIITPGIYKIYTSPWGKMSNKVQFTVIGSTSSVPNSDNTIHVSTTQKNIESATTTIQRDVLQLRVESELLYSNMNSYASLCSGNKINVSASKEISSLVASILNALKISSQLNSGIQCLSVSEKYVVYVPVDSLKYSICIDNTGKWAIGGSVDNINMICKQKAVIY